MPSDIRSAPPHDPPDSRSATRPHTRRSVLAWPAWLRVLVVLPAVALLWLAVAWANRAVAPW